MAFRPGGLVSEENFPDRIQFRQPRVWAYKPGVVAMHDSGFIATQQLLESPCRLVAELVGVL